MQISKSKPKKISILCTFKECNSHDDIHLGLQFTRCYSFRDVIHKIPCISGCDSQDAMYLGMRYQAMLLQMTRTT
jgi:hypothetical protein